MLNIDWIRSLDTLLDSSSQRFSLSCSSLPFTKVARSRMETLAQLKHVLHPRLLTPSSCAAPGKKAHASMSLESSSSAPAGRILGPGGCFGDGLRHGGVAGRGGEVVARGLVVCLLINKELLQDVHGGPLTTLLDQLRR